MNRVRPAGFRVFKTKFATIGVLICWDQWYPEAARITALMGAQVLFYPTAIGWHPKEKAEWGAAQADAWRTAQRAHAIANGVFVAAANRVGFEAEPGTDGLEFFGHSFVCDPFGRMIAEAGTDAGDSHRGVRSRADRVHAPQLALLPRPAHRRVRADPQPLDRVIVPQRSAYERRMDDAHFPGQRMPAEWEPHAATWIAWPHHEPDWPGKFEPIPWVYAEIVRVLHAHEHVEILCHDETVARGGARRRSPRTAWSSIAWGCTSCPPTASGCATPAPRRCMAPNGTVHWVSWDSMRGRSTTTSRAMSWSACR